MKALRFNSIMALMFMLLFMFFTGNLSAQNSNVTLLTSHFHAGDTLYTPNFSYVYSWDSIKTWIASSDSVKVYVDYMKAGSTSSTTSAYGSWTTIDSLIGAVDGGTTAPYGNLVMSTASFRSTPFSIKYRLRFISTANGGGYYGLFKFGHLLIKH
jgi:hypothetical protein